MAPKGVQRKLAAILFADVVGYSRLVGADEEGTIARLKVLRDEVIDPSIVRHHGRIVKTTGDGLLVEFASVVDAIRNAAEIQRAMAERNASLPEGERIAFRVGVNLGDIVIEGEDILGDGVNVASRLEGLAEPGGVCVSGTAFDQVRDKIDVGYEYLGEQEVKNIERPVRVYRVLLEPEAAGTVVGEAPAPRRLWQQPVLAVLGVVLLVIGGFAIWSTYRQPAVEPASIERMAFPLPDKPSIAVLPFDNLSGDPDQEYLGDGITENVIASLSKVSEMLVIARNSTFTYKGKPVKVQQVAEELGVRYVLEGSVQRSGDELRVTAQLIDAVEGHHLWSERYDRQLEDLFAVQDDITQKIVTALQVELTEGEQARVRAQSTNNLEAWGYSVRGSSLAVRATKEDNARTRELFERAVELDPNYAWAWAMIARTHWYDARFGWSASRANSSRKAVENVKKALALDPEDAEAHALMGGIYLVRREYDKALAEGRKALELGPNMAQVKATVAYTMRTLGEWDEAIALSESAMRAHPSHPSWYLLQPGIAYIFKGEFASAIATAERALRRAESNFMKAGFNLYLAGAHSEAGHEDDARRHMAEVLKLNPAFSVRFMRRISFYKNPAHLERYLDALRKAGLPE